MEVYHYTSVEGAYAIRRERYIRQTPLGGRHAHFGAGVYLTTMAPNEARRSQIAMNNWGRWGMHMADKGKMDYAIKLIMPRGLLLKAAADGRDVYVHRGDINLDNYYYEILNV